MPVKTLILVFSLLVALSLPALAGDPEQAAARPSTWALPIQKDGLPNLNKVSDNLYRGAQPAAEGMKVLENMGIKAVVNLRLENSDEDMLKGTNLKGFRIRVNTPHPEEEDVVRLLKLVTDPANQPVFVHCHHGADRTGMMMAFYRIVVQGWSKEDAIREMLEGGYGFHSIWNQIVNFVRNADIDRLRKLTGIQAPPPVPDKPSTGPTCPQCQDGFGTNCYYDRADPRASRLRGGIQMPFDAEEVCFAVEKFSSCGHCYHHYQVRKGADLVDVSREEYERAKAEKNKACNNCLGFMQYGPG